MSEASAMAVAWYAPVSPANEGQSVMSTGTITVAAESPARPGPMPASADASMRRIVSKSSPL